MVNAIRAGDNRYDDIRKGWNLLHQSAPSEILLPEDVDEAAWCLDYVLSQKLPFRIRSGGHDINGYSVADSAVVIDLRNLSSITISNDRASATVGPGVRLGRLYSTLAEQNLVVPAGVCGDVAVGGHALGGGNGYLQRLLGASCDQVIALEMLDANGRLLRASADENAELFWALRGAGNANFGLVVAYTYRTTRVENLTIFATSWNWDDYEAIIDQWQHWAPFVDARLTSTLTLTKDSVAVMGMFAGPREDLLAILPEFLIRPSQKLLVVEQFAGYDNALTALMAHYTEGDDALEADRAVFAATAVMCDLLSSEALGTFKEAVLRSPGLSSVVFFARGGQICGVPEDHNAYRYRSQLLEPMIRTTWADDREREACLNWVSTLYEQLKPNFQGVYKNWASAYVESNPYQWYGEYLPQLVHVKRKFDPNNLFSNPQSIPVSVSPAQVKQWQLPHSVVRALREQGALSAGI